MQADGLFYSFVGIAVISVRTFRNGGFLFVAVKLVHVHISTAFKCGVCTLLGPLCVRRRDCDGFSYRHDDIISLEFTVSSQSLRIIALVVTHAHSLQYHADMCTRAHAGMNVRVH